MRVGRAVYEAQGGIWAPLYADPPQGSAADEHLPWLREWSAETDARLSAAETPRAIVTQARFAATAPGLLTSHLYDLGTADQYASAVVGPLGGGAADVRQRIAVCGDAGLSSFVAVDVLSDGSVVAVEAPLDIVQGALAPRVAEGDTVSIEAVGASVTVRLRPAGGLERVIYETAITPAQRLGTFAGVVAYPQATASYVGASLVATVGAPQDVRLLLGAVGAPSGGGTEMEPRRLFGAAGEPLLLNGYGVYGAGFALPSFQRIGSRVYLDGVLSPGPSATAFAQLPAGYAPAESCLGVALTSGGSARIDVLSNGVCTVADAVNFASLAGFSFPI